MKKPIGKIKTKKTVYCEICGSSYKRTSSINIYSIDPRETKKAKADLVKKSRKKYTCRICKTIKKELREK